MSTRRQILEQALVERRIALWNRLDRDLRYGASDFDTTLDVAGIRACCEALGYVTDWHDIPTEALSWWELVETIPSMSLAPRGTDWPDLLGLLVDPDIEFHPVTEDQIAVLGLVKSYPMLALTQGDPDEE